jgi:hypothetical protein
MTTTRETLTAAVNAARAEVEAARLACNEALTVTARATMGADRSARARALWAQRAAFRASRVARENVKAARAALVAAGYSEED